MHKPNTRSKSSASKTLTPIDPNSVTTRGRGRTPLKTNTAKLGETSLPRRSISISSLPNSQSSTSLRAVRSSSTTRSLDSDDKEDTEEVSVIESNLNCQLLDRSIPELNVQSLESLIEDKGFIDNQEHLNSQLLMATRNNDSGAGPSNAGERRQNVEVNSMETLMSYLQEAMRTTRDEFRRELSAIRETLGQPRNDRSSPVAGSLNDRQPNSQVNSFSNASSTFSVKLKDWKVVYNGEGNVNDFLFKIDTLTERSQCPLDHLMANFHMFLSQKAEIWYWMFIKQNPRVTYPILKTALIKEFGTLETENEILLKISTRRQLSKENYDDFHSSIVQMNLKLRTPMSDISLIEIIKKNVNPELRIMLFISDPKDLGELRLLARKAEKVLQESKVHTNTLGKPRQVNEISIENVVEEPDEPDPQVEALKLNRTYANRDYSKIKCWNCQNFGHSYIYCPDETRHVFCFKCGQRNVTTPKCNGPHQENRRRSEWVTGDARSLK